MNLSGQSIKDTYGGILNIGATGLTGSLKTITDGFGNPLPMQVSETGVNFTGDVTGISPAVRTGTSILLDSPSVYGTPTSPETGNITLATGPNNPGVSSILVHSSFTTPTFASEFEQYYLSYQGSGTPQGTYIEADLSIGFTQYNVAGISPGAINSMKSAGGTAYYFAGAYNQYKGLDVGSSLIRLFDDGSVDPSFSTGTGFYNFTPEQFGTVTAIDVDNSTGKIYVAGLFDSYNGTLLSTEGPPGLCRLNSNGTLDTTFLVDGTQFKAFTSGISSGNLYDVLAIQGGGGCFVAGGFLRFSNNTDYAGVLRFTNTGSVYNSGVWDSSGWGLVGGSSMSISSIARASDGNIVAGGYFTQYQSDGSFAITKLDGETGARIATFVSGSGMNNFGFISKVLIDSSDNIYAGGNQQSYNGNTSFALTKISATGAFIGAFSTGTMLYPNGGINDLGFDASENLWAAGTFAGTTGGNSVFQIMHLNSSGSPIANWQFPNPAFDSGPSAILPIASGQAFAGFSGRTFRGEPAGSAVLVSATGGYDTTFDTVTGTIGVPNYITFTYYSDEMVKYNIFQ
jgi:hypothetical protein